MAFYSHTWKPKAIWWSGGSKHLLYHGKVFTSFFRDDRLKIITKFPKMSKRDFHSGFEREGGLKFSYQENFFEKCAKKINRFVVDLSFVSTCTGFSFPVYFFNRTYVRILFWIPCYFALKISSTVKRNKKALKLRIHQRFQHFPGWAILLNSQQRVGESNPWFRRERAAS